MAQALNLSADQGANVTFSITVRDSSNVAIDLTGYTANASFKRHFESANSVAFVTNTYANGLLTISLLANVTSAISSGRYVYDATVTETASNTTTRVSEGILTIKANVT